MACKFDSVLRANEMTHCCSNSNVRRCRNNVRGGRTFHRRFGAPIPCFSDSSSKLKLNSRETKIIREAKLIMIDEISMMNWKLMNMFERFLWQVMDCDKHMGGKCVVVMGDMRQCPPVVVGGQRAHVVSDSVTKSECWEHFQVHKMKKS